MGMNNARTLSRPADYRAAMDPTDRGAQAGRNYWRDKLGAGVDFGTPARLDGADVTIVGFSTAGVYVQGAGEPELVNPAGRLTVGGAA